MKNENETLLKPFFDPTFDPAVISETEWEKKFKPCPFDKFQSLMGAL